MSPSQKTATPHVTSQKLCARVAPSLRSRERSVRIAAGLSVLLPSYNASAFLGEALLSLQKQTFVDFEIIAVDDGSTDGTGDLLMNFAACAERVTVVNAALHFDQLPRADDVFIVAAVGSPTARHEIRVALDGAGLVEGRDYCAVA